MTVDIGNYSSAAAFRQALEDRLKTEALQTGVAYDRCGRKPRFSACWLGCSASLLKTAGP